MSFARARGFTTFSHFPERSMGTAAVALQHGTQFSRPLTNEQQHAAVLAMHAQPTHFLTVHSQFSREEVMKQFRALMRQMGCRSSRGSLPTYFAVVARSAQGGSGHHVHALLWAYMHAPVLQGRTKALGLGRPDIQFIGAKPFGERLQVISYVVGQHAPVFGTRHHERHAPRPKGARRFLYSQLKTLRQSEPKLFEALTSVKEHMEQDKATFP